MTDDVYLARFDGRRALVGGGVNAVALLASHDAGWVTGHALPVDGGLLRGGALRHLLDQAGR